MEIFSFPPIATRDAKLLILGSMPGKASLAANQYYAHPRNLFWSLLGELAGAYPHLDYAERIRILNTRGIAVWDVLKSCRRAGSLDSDIEKASMITNDFLSFFTEHPHIKHIFFNGATAEQTFRKQVLPTLDKQSFELNRLPSSSPAHAAVSFQEKLHLWRIIVDHGFAGDN